MTAPKQPPRLMRGGLTGRIYVVTRYRVREDRGDGTALFEAITKYDVTEDFERLAAEVPKSGGTP